MHIHVSISGSFNPPRYQYKKLINTWHVLSYPVVIGCTRQLWALLCDYEDKQAHLKLIEKTRLCCIRVSFKQLRPRSGPENARPDLDPNFLIL